eukprot:m.228137 g.228137  ORF g.228137 m.228137 type:complete len:640 (-) comp17410_c0_seq1:45-1964(-)
MSEPSQAHLVSFGEAMVRFAPVATDIELPDEAGCGTFLRSVGGDELNVCVAIAQLDGTSKPAPTWVSVLPTGAMGDVVMRCGEHAGVDMSLVHRVVGADVGVFVVLPEQQTVHYQRRHSAFALHDPAIFNWDKILSTLPGKQWLHVTGITPLVSAQALASWQGVLAAAQRLAIPVSMDFNHRKQLGTLTDLWGVIKPHAAPLQILIFSTTTFRELADLTHLSLPSLPDDSASTWPAAMAAARVAWGMPRLAVCFKTRAADGLQRRWSVIATATGLHTTVNQPVLHRPRDECGGGSAWAAGILDAFWNGLLEETSQATPADPTVLCHDSSVAAAARHADLLAAMCQETIGDHSHVTRAQLSAVEDAHKNAEVNLCTLFPRDPGPAAAPLTTLPCVPTTARPPPPNHAAALDETYQRLLAAGVVAILRAKNPDAAIARAKELISIGCRAIEVTLDSTDWRRVLREIAAGAPAHVAVGVGTVMDDTVCLLPEIAALGGQFALSPINPIGFIDACHEVGVLAVPSGFTSNELWDLHRCGARMIKLFHAATLGPAGLKSILSVSPLRAMTIVPSGGIGPDTLAAWWDAGAKAVGMGTNLAGGDIACAPGSAEASRAHEQWVASGHDAAVKVFAMVAARFPLTSK